MPLPKPNPSEKKTDFVSRCMGSEVMNKDFPDGKQRFAVCMAQTKAKIKTNSKPSNGPNKRTLKTNKAAIRLEENKVIDDRVRPFTDGILNDPEDNEIQVNRFTKKYKDHKGKRHLVVPVVMMTEGVHAGSHGPLYHSALEFGKYSASWNGIPVVVTHPKKDGSFISANSPEVIDNQAVGAIYNTHTEDGKLKAEAWLDEDKLMRVSPVAAAYIKEGKQLEVSIGVFTDDDFVNGEWNGEAYSAVARNHRPDHLALLPGERGACSWEDGCGVRTNMEGGAAESEYTSMSISVNQRQTNKGDIKTMEKCCPEKVEMLVMSEDTGFDEDDRGWLSELDEDQMDKLVTLAKAAEAPPEEDEMTMLRAENAALKAELAKFKKAPVANKEMAIEVLKEQLSDPAQFLQLLPAEQREQMEHGMQLYRDHRMSIVESIKTNTSVYTDDELMAMSTKDLDKLAKAIVKPSQNYVGLGSGRINTNTAGKELLLPPGVN